MGDAAFGGVGHRAPELLERDVFAGHRLDDLGAGDEHLRDLLGHDDEVGDRRRIHRAARARTRDQADLRNNAAGLDVAPKDLGVAAQRNHALLNARAARVVDADHRRAGAHRQIHHLADLLGVRFAERSAEHGEILREKKHLASVDRRAAGDDAVTEELFFVHPERARAVHDEAVEFGKGPLVDQRLDALPRGPLAALVLLGDRFGARRGQGELALAAQLLVLLVVGSHGVPRCTGGRAHPGAGPGETIPTSRA